MRSIIQAIKTRIYQHLIQPLVESVSPIHETALGAAIGMFVGLTPTVGLQMWIVFIIWLGFRYFLKLRFDLLVSTALVWISNPFTMFFLYYGFLVTGYTFLSISGIHAGPLDLSYAAFNHQLSQAIDTQQYSGIEIIANGTRFLLVDLGYPMLIGCLFYAIPFSVLSYALSKRYLTIYRMQKAKKMGLDYEKWRELFERRPDRK
ncbi:DUF2062 domain-containing protein [bacterium]|nr:DUF2062 domain-containing protein [bacterium]